MPCDPAGPAGHWTFQVSKRSSARQSAGELTMRVMPVHLFTQALMTVPALACCAPVAASSAIAIKPRPFELLFIDRNPVNNMQ
jgi:hypothetical protein